MVSQDRTILVVNTTTGAASYLITPSNCSNKLLFLYNAHEVSINANNTYFNGSFTTKLGHLFTSENIIDANKGRVKNRMWKLCKIKGVNEPRLCCLQWYSDSSYHTAIVWKNSNNYMVRCESTTYTLTETSTETIPFEDILF